MRRSTVAALFLVVPLSVLPAAGRPDPAAPAQATAEKPWPPAGVFRVGQHGSPGVTAPKLIKDIKPNYTAAAMTAKIAGTVVMEAVVHPDGTVGEVRVTKSLDREFGLDDEAVRALKMWQFQPGTKDGAPVPVLVVVEMDFTVRK